MPLKNSINKLSLQEMINSILPNDIGIKTVEKCVKIFSKFWPVLK